MMFDDDEAPVMEAKISESDLGNAVQVLAAMARAFSDSPHWNSAAAASACFTAQGFLSEVAVAMANSESLQQAIGRALEQSRR